MTNAAGLDFHSDVSGGGLAQTLLDQPEAAAGAIHLYLLHELNLA